MKRLLSFFMCVAVLASLMVVSAQSATSATPDIAIEAPSAVLMHSSGKVLFEKDPHKELEPASVTKVMTLLLIFEAIDSGLISVSDKVTVSANAANMGGSQVYLKEGEVFSVHDMLKCIVVASANDCSVAMAEHLAGSEESFVQKMNGKAQSLGMEHTNFENCSGLPAKNHYTSAYDIALMSVELLKHEKIKDYTLIWMDTIRDGAFTLSNTNRLVKTFDGITGLKTGSTSTAGFCISATARRDGMDLVAVIMKSPNKDIRNKEAAALLNYGFANYACVNLTPDTPIMPVEVNMGKQSHVLCDLMETPPQVYEKSKLSVIEKEISVPQSLNAPVSAGDEIGQMIVRAEGKVIVTIPIVAKENVEKKSIWDYILEFFRFVTMR